jgi:hypothetical protein
MTDAAGLDDRGQGPAGFRVGFSREAPARV